MKFAQNHRHQVLTSLGRNNLKSNQRVTLQDVTCYLIGLFATTFWYGKLFMLLSYFNSWVIHSKLEYNSEPENHSFIVKYFRMNFHSSSVYIIFTTGIITLQTSDKHLNEKAVAINYVDKKKRKQLPIDIKWENF